MRVVGVSDTEFRRQVDGRHGGCRNRAGSRRRRARGIRPSARPSRSFAREGWALLRRVIRRATEPIGSRRGRRGGACRRLCALGRSWECLGPVGRVGAIQVGFVLVSRWRTKSPISVLPRCSRHYLGAVKAAAHIRSRGAWSVVCCVIARASDGRGGWSSAGIERPGGNGIHPLQKVGRLLGGWGGIQWFPKSAVAESTIATRCPPRFWRRRVIGDLGCKVVVRSPGVGSFDGRLGRHAPRTARVAHWC